MEKIPRRSFLTLAASAIAGKVLGLPEAKAAPRQFEYKPSEMTDDTLEAQRSDAAMELLNEFWPHEDMRKFAIENYFGGESDPSQIYEQLLNESTMYVPSPEVCESVLRDNREKLNELAEQVPEGKYGFFVSGGRQRLYVLQKREGKMHFIKAYKDSTSIKPWSHEENSEGTPPGIHWIVEEKKGFLGEVVSAANKYAQNFATVYTGTGRNRTPHTMVRNLQRGTDPIAELITRRFLLWGKKTPIRRAINIHGGNRIDLLGEEGSGGCVRLSNVDMMDIAKYIEVGVPNADPKKNQKAGTPVMLHYGPRRRVAGR